MDFVGMLACEQEDVISVDILYSKKAFLYDLRYRKTSLEEYYAAVAVGLLITPDEATIDTKGLCFYDSYQILNKICDYYLTAEPKYMLISNDSLCDQRRDSFRYWLAKLTSRLRYGPRGRVYSANNILLYSETMTEFLDQSMNQLLKLFSSLPREVISNGRLASHFGLPVIADKRNSDSLIEKWLLIMTWCKIVNTELHPVLCNLRSNLETGSKMKFSRIKRTETLGILRALYARCLELKSRNKFKLENFLVGESIKIMKLKSNLPRLRVPDKINKEFFSHIIRLSTDVSDLVVAYLADIKWYNAEESFRFFEARVKSRIVEFHNRIETLLTHRYFFSNFEVDMCLASLMENIEKFIKKYYKRKFAITTTFGEENEIRQRIVYRIQKFLLDMLSTISASVIETLCLYYRLKMKKEFVKRMIKNVSLHITWTTMNIVLNYEQLSGNSINEILFEQFAKPLDLTNVENILTRNILQECIKKLYDQYRIGEIHVFTIRPESIKAMYLPISYMYEDFFPYLATFSHITGMCGHPVHDLDLLTDGRLKKFMTECIVCLHVNMTATDEVFEHAKEYIRYFERM